MQKQNKNTSSNQQQQQQQNKAENYLLKPTLIWSGKSNINIDCIKVCPMDNNIWGMCYYHQIVNKQTKQQSFKGGIQVLHTDDLQKQISQQQCKTYVNMDPIMHIQWLSVPKYMKQESCDEYYYILAANRCDKASIIAYNTNKKQLMVLRQINLGMGVFCLYCDWVLVSGCQQQVKDAICVVSSNQSVVYQFDISIRQNCENLKEWVTIKGQQQQQLIHQYTKHQYAVWACKLQPTLKNKYLVVGDEINTLYLYDTQHKILIAKNNKAHSQGICEIIWVPNQSIQAHPSIYGDIGQQSHVILTGSFDGTIAMIDINSFGQCMRKFSVFVEGSTIWRIILPHFNKKQQHQWLICNSSINKFQILDVGSSAQNSKIVWDSGEMHESLAYAADWNGEYILSGSFYDRNLGLWKIDKN